MSVKRDEIINRAADGINNRPEYLIPLGDMVMKSRFLVIQHDRDQTVYEAPAGRHIVEHMVGTTGFRVLLDDGSVVYVPL